MSKADRIRMMLANGSTVKLIALAIGCAQTYVRTVKQRTSPSGNPIETRAHLRWRSTPYAMESGRQRARRRYYAAKAEAAA